MKKPADVTFSFDNVINPIEDGDDFTQHAYTPLSDPHIFKIVYNLMFHTGVFNDECNEWNRRPVATQTWTFTADYDMYIILHQTSAQAGYQSSNTEQAERAVGFREATTESFANLATATTNNRGAVVQLIAMDAALLTQIAALTT
jgi:hypothetical protein